MKNPLLGAVNQSRLAGQIAPIKNLMNTIKAAQNPQAAMTQMLQNNPQYSRLTQLLKENNGNAQQAFYNLANQMGMNGDEIINMLK